MSPATAHSTSAAWLQEDTYLSRESAESHLGQDKISQLSLKSLIYFLVIKKHELISSKVNYPLSQ